MFLPIIYARNEVSKETTTFHLIDKTVVVTAPEELMRHLIRVCDGRRALSEVIEELSRFWSKSSLKNLIAELRKKEVLIDSRFLSKNIWKTIENPSHFPQILTNTEIESLEINAQTRHKSQNRHRKYQVTSSSLTELIENRHSASGFSKEAVKLQQIVNILWSVYGERDGNEKLRWGRTVPSAGALYPLVIHIALFKKSEGLSIGVYKVSYNSYKEVAFELVSQDTNRFVRSFLDPLMVSRAHGVIVISGSFQIAGAKYGNRSMLYVPLEAGHAAQNAHLVAVEQEVETVEIGGFIDQLLTEALDLPSEYRPLTTIAFGYENQLPEKEDLLALEVEWAIPMAGTYRLPFSIASAKISSKRSWSHGRDPSPSIALTKAIAEAKEWTACGSIPELVTSTYRDLGKAVDPRKVISFHPAQYRMKNFPFTSFDEEAPYAWTKGIEYTTGSTVFILADLVYFPYFPETPYHAFANSSGCAAHPNKKRVVELATLELIERDSFMNAYLGKLPFPTIEEDSLPLYLQRRVRALRSIGFNVCIKDHSIDLAPVAMVFAQNDDLMFSTCASCASFDVEYAVQHALTEVEALILARLQNGQPSEIRPEEVGNPSDHGKLYGQQRYYRRSNFLVTSEETISLQKMGTGMVQSWNELLKRLRDKGLGLYVIPLILSENYGGNGDLHIVRSIVPGLTPMTFGYRQEPAGMERIYEVAQKLGGRKLGYRDLTKFPHPFE